MAPLVRKNPALFMPHVRSSSRAPPSFCVMNSAAPRPLRELPACVRDEESFLRHKTGGPVPQLPPAAPRSPASYSQSFFFFPLPFLSLSPLLVFILHLIAVLSRIPPSASYPLPPALPPSPSASAATGEEGREREREECG